MSRAAFSLRATLAVLLPLTLNPVASASSPSTPSLTEIVSHDLVQNGDFKSNTNGWTVAEGSAFNVAWSPIDRFGSGSSGSIALTITDTSTVTEVTQCVDAFSGLGLFGYSYYVTGSSGPGELELYFTYYTAAGCAGEPLSSKSGAYPPNPPLGSWRDVGPWEIKPYSGTVSMKIHLRADQVEGIPNKLGSRASFTAHFDSILLGPKSDLNYVQNPDFDSNLSSWTEDNNIDGIAEWSPEDANGDSSSGSLRIVTSGTSGKGVSQCVNVSLDQITFGAKVMVPNQSSEGSFSMGVGFYSGTNCSGSFGGSTTGPFEPPPGEWVDLGPDPRRTGISNAHSFEVFLRAESDVGTYTAYFDDVVLNGEGGSGPAPPANVTITGATSGRPGHIMYFRAVGTNCSGALDSGWSWSAGGGTILGYFDRDTVAMRFPAEGTYIVTASHPSCGSGSDTHTVLIESGGPNVWIWPGASYMFQPVGTTLGNTSYWMNNSGDRATTVFLESEGDFFTQTPTSVVLDPRKWEEIDLNAKDVPVGFYQDRVYFTGDGISDYLQREGQLIQLYVFDDEPTDGDAEPQQTRVDVKGGNGVLRYSNTGTMPLKGQVVVTEPWIVPDENQVTIQPGAVTDVGFSIDRTNRPDADDPFGSVAGELGVRYLTTSGASKGRPPATRDEGSVTTSLVTIIDTAPPDTSVAGIPALGQNEVALFIPGVGHVEGSVGTFISDLSMVNLDRFDTISDLKVYFNPLPGSVGPGSQESSIDSVQPNQPIALADVISTVFDAEQQGSLQIRSSNIENIGVTATVFNSSNPAGTFGTTIPVIRSDRGVTPGNSIYLTGLRADATHHTNLYIQEMSGTSVSVTTTFLGEAGNVMGTRDDTIAGFALKPTGAVVPAGAVSARLTNSGQSGTFFAFATPLDEESGDTWAVSDWPQQLGYSRAEAAVIPVAGALRGTNNTFFRTDVAIMNTGSIRATGTLRYLDRSGPTYDEPISLAPGETIILEDITTNLFGITTDTVGHMTWTPTAGEVVITSRNFTTVADGVATFGSGVPTLAVSSSLGEGDLIRFGGIEDSTQATVASERPASFRTNFGMVETTGNPVTVRVTVRYEIPTTLASARDEASRDYPLGGNGFLLVGNIVNSVLGSDREVILGDLRNVEVDFELSSGNGKVAVFTSSVDNGTGDSILRTE